MNRKCGVTLDDVQDVARTHKEVKAVTNQLNALRNTRSMIGERIRRAAQQKDEKGKEEAMAEATNVKKEIAMLEDKLAALVAEACLAVMPPNPKNFNVDNVRVVKIMGSSLNNSTVVQGMVFGREPEGA